MSHAHWTVPLPAGVQVARARLGDLGDDAALARLLTPGEIARLHAMQAGRRREYLVSRALLKLLFLERRALGAGEKELEASCREIESVREAEGSARAPRLRWRGEVCRGLYVSITHAAGWAGVGLSTSGPIGVDLAVVGERLPSFYRAHFSARERDWVARGGESSSVALHTLLWTLKESVVKTGIAPGATLWGYDEIEVLVDLPPRHVATHCQTLGGGELASLQVRVPLASETGAQRAWFTRAEDALFSIVTLEVAA